YLSDGDMLAMDLWPQRMGRRVSDITDLSSMAPHDVIPCDFEGVCRWCELHTTVHPDTGVRHHELVHSLTEERDKYHALIRVQGFLKAIHFGPFGNYTGYDESCVLAMLLTIHIIPRRPHKAAKAAVLAHVKRLIHETLGCTAGAEESEGTIHLERKVFTQVRGTADSQTRSVLGPAEDPHGYMHKLDGKWVVAHKLQTLLQTPQGAIAPTHPFIFRTGDFVEVVIFVHVTTFFQCKQLHADVRFALQKVVRL
ncbi:hypothetical protein OBBRIDRAFT_689580, partial [Obba rivulosa]